MGWLKCSDIRISYLEDISDRISIRSSSYSEGMICDVIVGSASLRMVGNLSLTVLKIHLRELTGKGNDLSPIWHSYLAGCRCYRYA